MEKQIIRDFSKEKFKLEFDTEISIRDLISYLQDQLSDGFDKVFIVADWEGEVQDIECYKNRPETEGEANRRIELKNKRKTIKVKYTPRFPSFD